MTWAGIANQDEGERVVSSRCALCAYPTEGSESAQIGFREAGRTVEVRDMSINGVHFNIDENCADSLLPSIYGTESGACSDVL